MIERRFTMDNDWPQVEFCHREVIEAINRKDPKAAYNWTKRLMMWLRPSNARISLEEGK